MDYTCVMKWSRATTSLLLLLLVFADLSTTEKTNETVQKPPEEALGNVFKFGSQPNLVVKDADGQACLLATINATMKISYRVPEVIVHETYWAVADIQLPENVTSHGVCGQNVSHLILKWDNGTFNVDLTFSIKEPKSKGVNATWSLTDIAVTYSLSNKVVFPGAVTDDKMTVDGHKLSLFTSPVGAAYECGHDVNVDLGGSDRNIHITFRSLQIAAFGVVSTEFPTDAVYCSETDEEDDDDENVLIPLIIACCLCSIVLFIVIGYVISKKLQQAREQSDYRPM